MDRLLLITKHYKYRMIITTQRLKIIVAFIFVSSIGFSFFDVYYVLYLERHFSIYKILLLSMMVILPLMIVVAHTYILCYVYRRSNDISHCKVSGKNNNKKILNSIMFILISQVITTLRILSMQVLITLDIFSGFINANLELCDILNRWSELIQTCQFFINGMILLINHRENTTKTKIKTQEVVCLKDF